MFVLFQLMVNGIPLSNNPFHKGISGIQTTQTTQTTHLPLADCIDLVTHALEWQVAFASHLF